MRLGQNPLKDRPAPYNIKPIVFVVITHLPDGNDNYHSQRFEVIKTCLNTMKDGSKMDHTFMIWDNGSEDGFRQWLQNIFDPDILILSKNIGLSAAKASAIQLLPLSSVVCYSDDDMLFSDNWLMPQLEILNHYPNVASVSGYPVHTMMNYGNENTIEWAKKNATVKHGQLIPEQWNRDFCKSVGYNYDEWVQRHTRDFDTLITYNGVKAYATSHHAQFIGHAVKLVQAMRYDNLSLGPERDMDIMLDKIGLRLSTTERYVQHIGNVMDEEMIQEKELSL